MSQLLREDLITAQKTLMGNLKPRFVLIGSIGEGTRNFIADEIDLTVENEGLKNHPFELIDDDAAQLKVPPRLRFLKKFEDDNHVFDYPKFLMELFRDLRSALERIQQDKSFPKSLKMSLSPFKPCKDCLATTKRSQSSVYNPFTHCKNCFPTLTHSKLGPCLILQYQDGEVSRVVSVDLILTIPVKATGSLDLFQKVIKTLIGKKYPSWLKYMDSIMARDLLLPEAIGTLDSDKTSVDVAVKILHYGQKNNYIIRPAQEMEISNFHNNQRLKHVYISIKLLRDLRH